MERIKGKRERRKREKGKNDMKEGKMEKKGRRIFFVDNLMIF